MFQGLRSIFRLSLPVTVAAVVGAGVVLAPPGRPHLTAAADPTVRLTATALPLDPNLLDSAAIVVQQFASEVAAALLTPSAAAGSVIGDGIESLYLFLESWVQYGVDLLSWAVGWVPVAGLLAPQINIFYDLGEANVRSLLFNTVDFLDGSIGFGQALSNIGTDSANAFNAFVNAQINWFTGLLPPFPPLPGLPPPPPVAAAVSAPADGALFDLGGSPCPDGVPTDPADAAEALLSLTP